MLDKEELGALVPHSGKMLLLSRIKEYDLSERTLSAECDITEDNIFYDSAIGGVPAWVGFEFIAQAISSLSGLWGREKGEKPKIGFILSVSAMQINIPFFKTGSIVNVRVKESARMEQVYTFEGEVLLEDRSVLKGKLTVMDADDDQTKSLAGRLDQVG
ncbi:MAG: thioester dehydrase [Spirochaetes bacterium]|nr:thioester dehydrase [Spirochaetota bacterium]